MCQRWLTSDMCAVSKRQFCGWRSYATCLSGEIRGETIGTSPGSSRPRRRVAQLGLAHDRQDRFAKSRFAGSSPVRSTLPCCRCVSAVPTRHGLPGCSWFPSASIHYGWPLGSVLASILVTLSLPLTFAAAAICCMAMLAARAMLSSLGAHGLRRPGADVAPLG